MAERKGYLRLNHFHGLRLETEDFEAGEKYHLDKMRLHNQCMHSPGIVRSWPHGNLKVVGRGRGDLSVEVNPGYAIDADGHDVFLHDPEIVAIDPGQLKLPATVYIALKYVDEPVDFVVNKANPKFRGHRRIYEGSKVEAAAKEPKGGEGVELARVLIQQDTKEIIDAKDPFKPGPGEIDLRYVRTAGVAGSYLDPGLQQKLLSLLGLSRRVFGEFARRGIVTGRELRGASITLEMLLATGNLNLPDAMKGVRILGELLPDFLNEAQEKFPELGKLREYGDFKETTQGLSRFLEGARDLVPDLDSVLGFLGSATDKLKVVIDSGPMPEAAPPPRPASAEPEAPPEEKPSGKRADAREVSWEDLQKLGEMPKFIYFDGRNWEMKDSVDMLESGSETAHAFEMGDFKQSWYKRNEAKYPDGTPCKAGGRAHVGGWSQWKMKGMIPGKDVIIAKRIDFSRGDLKCEIQVNGKPVGNWDIDGSDRRFAWRNWLYRVSGENIASAEPVVRQVAKSAERDINVFGLWHYQAID